MQIKSYNFYPFCPYLSLFSEVVQNRMDKNGQITWPSLSTNKYMKIVYFRRLLVQYIAVKIDDFLKSDQILPRL